MMLWLFQDVPNRKDISQHAGLWKGWKLNVKDTLLMRISLWSTFFFSHIQKTDSLRENQNLKKQKKNQKCCQYQNAVRCEEHWISERPTWPTARRNKDVWKNKWTCTKLCSFLWMKQQIFWQKDHWKLQEDPVPGGSSHPASKNKNHPFGITVTSNGIYNSAAIRIRSCWLTSHWAVLCGGQCQIYSSWRARCHSHE